MRQQGMRRRSRPLVGQIGLADQSWPILDFPRNGEAPDEIDKAEQSRDRLATSYLPLLNQNASTAFLEILK